MLCSARWRRGPRGRPPRRAPERPRNQDLDPNIPQIHAQAELTCQYQQFSGNIHAREILNTKKKLNEILARHTGQDVEQVRHDTERDKFLSAIEAKEYGLIDDVIMPRKEIGVAPAA